MEMDQQIQHEHLICKVENSYLAALMISRHAYTVKLFHGAPFLTEKRMFAMADTGIPDGIKCDTEGRVYSGTGDGVSIWAPNGMLLAKIIVPGGCANFCFGRPGEMFILNETRFWVAKLHSDVQGALLQDHFKQH